MTEPTPSADGKTWSCWIDMMGQVYEPGDFVAVAVVNDKSPQMVFGEVIQINRVNSKGELHEIVHRDGGDRKLYKAWQESPRVPYDGNAGNRWSGTKPRPPSQAYVDAQAELTRRAEAWRATVVETRVPMCTVKVKPLIDSRGFYRSGDTGYGLDRKPGDHKAVTYQLPANILKVDHDVRAVAESLRGEEDGDDAA